MTNKRFLNPEEIWMMEQYVSADYYLRALEAWRKVVVHVENMLDEYEKLPLKNRRNREEWEQADAVWGCHLMPSFYNTLNNMERSYLAIREGHIEDATSWNGPSYQRRGSSEYWSGWMGKEGEAKFNQLIGDASDLIDHSHWTVSGTTNCFSLKLSKGYDVCHINPPKKFPTYRLSESVSFKSGEVVPQNGLYAPEQEFGSLRFWRKGQKSCEADVVISTNLNERPLKTEYQDTIWTLIERVDDGIPADPEPTTPSEKIIPRRRGEPGQIVPLSGWWWGAALPHENARRWFNKDETFPETRYTEKGEIFWVYETPDNPPKEKLNTKSFRDFFNWKA